MSTQNRTPNTDHRTPDFPPEEKPPFFKSWKTIYWIVIVFLFFQILLYNLITTALK